MTSSQKACPACKLPARIYAAACENCGHVFRTQFMPPVDQTQVLPPLPETHFAPHLARRKKKASAAVLAAVCVLVAALLVTAFSFARHGARQKVTAEAASSSSRSEISPQNTPGHPVRIAEAETLTPQCSQQHVLETLGAPLQNVNDIWSYPAEDGSVVGVKLAGEESARYVQGIAVLNNSGNLIWVKTPHLWKSMPATKLTGHKHALPLKTLARYLDYVTR